MGRAESWFQAGVRPEGTLGRKVFESSPEPRLIGMIGLISVIGVIGVIGGQLGDRGGRVNRGG